MSNQKPFDPPEGRLKWIESQIRGIESIISGRGSSMACERAAIRIWERQRDRILRNEKILEAMAAHGLDVDMAGTLSHAHSDQVFFDRLQDLGMSLCEDKYGDLSVIDVVFNKERKHYA